MTGARASCDSNHGILNSWPSSLFYHFSIEPGQIMLRPPPLPCKGDKVDEIALEMKERGYSQVPVLENGKPIGMLTERRILEMKKPYDDLLVEDAMEEAVIVPKETNYASIIPLLKQFQAVLVQDRGKMVGIITSTDLIGHKKKAK